MTTKVIALLRVVLIAISSSFMTSGQGHGVDAVLSGKASYIAHAGSSGRPELLQVGANFVDYLPGPQNHCPVAVR